MGNITCALCSPVISFLAAPRAGNISAMLSLLQADVSSAQACAAADKHLGRAGQTLSPLLRVQEIAGALLSLLQAALGSAQASAAARERLGRAVQTLSPIAGAALPPPPPAQAHAPALEPAQSSNGDLTGENANGVVAAGSDAAALAHSASMDDGVLRIPPSMAVLDRCELCCRVQQLAADHMLCILVPQTA